ncbi:hypothetical protein [Microbacterium sp. cx-59]|uniref:hypothetical protein n=1 Tax=Microbacterium sp. cx-59 TaxID=2891207 RepID=UPI001E2F59CE|nr:hypothetical protein [Microbacterium sp. cx-59]MCC4908887.1 hypothetical protein [Microbacterium sp. cx-59]
MIFYIVQFGPAVAGLIVGLVVWAIRRKAWATLPTRRRLWTAGGVGIALALWVAYSWWSVFPFWLPSFGEDGFVVFGFLPHVVPLVLCLVALAFAGVPSRVAGAKGAAQLSARNLFTFAPRPWMFLLAGVSAAIVVLTVVAGLASGPDEDGRYLMYTVQMSTNSSAGTSIYGWFYSVPCLVLVALVVAVSLLSLWAIGRPPLAADRERDSARRGEQARVVLGVASGGLLLHLGSILNSLYGTSMLRGGLDAGLAGWVELGTGFAAIGPALLVAGYIAIVAGLAAWWMVLLAVVIAGRRPAGRVPVR